MNTVRVVTLIMLILSDAVVWAQVLMLPRGRSARVATALLLLVPIVMVLIVMLTQPG
jgi:hypothetical protein